MKTEVRVDIFVGENEEEADLNGMTFFFDNYRDAKHFVIDYVKANSNYNARIIEVFRFGSDK